MMRLNPARYERQASQRNKTSCLIRKPPRSWSVRPVPSTPPFPLFFCLILSFASIQKDMLLVFEEETLDPLCDDSSLTLPLILDAIVLSVASLKASSLCWAWVLN